MVGGEEEMIGELWMPLVGGNSNDGADAATYGKTSQPNGATNAFMTLQYCNQARNSDWGGPMIDAACRVGLLSC